MHERHGLPDIAEIPEDAVDGLHRAMRRDVEGRDQPDGWIDRTLLAFPDAFGADRGRVFTAVRECVLRSGDERSRTRLHELERADVAGGAIARVRRILERRPSAVERADPAMVHYTGDELTIALAHPVPAAGARLAVRMQIPRHPETIYAGARRIDPSPTLLERWSALCGARTPHSVWRCDPPTWCMGQHEFAIEVVPNPSGFNEAMWIAASGGGRVLVTRRFESAGSAHWPFMPATVMPSGWSYLRGDRTMGMDQPSMPNGAPAPSDCVHVPDDDLFALCAAHAWPGSLRDAIWLQRRGEYRLLH